MYVFSLELLRVRKEMSKDNVKDLEFFLCQMHPPWTKSADGDVQLVFEQMMQRMIFVFDRVSKRCSFTRLAQYMEDIQRDDLADRLRTLGTFRPVSHFMDSFCSYTIMLCHFCKCICSVAFFITVLHSH